MNFIDRIKPLNNKILFQFSEDLDNSKFLNNVSKGGVHVVEFTENQVKRDRWGKVLAVGPEAREEIAPGEYILIESLGWTNAMKIDEDNEDENYWFTALDKVICVSDELPDEI